MERIKRQPLTEVEKQKDILVLDDKVLRKLIRKEVREYLDEGRATSEDLNYIG